MIEATLSSPCRVSIYTVIVRGHFKTILLFQGIKFGFGDSIPCAQGKVAGSHTWTLPVHM